jgi:hypothetical protein
MFQGSIPQDVRQILFEASTGWQSTSVAVACSGNFTAERVLHEAGRFTLAGCDVSIYSCALGAWFARQPFRLVLKPDYHASLGWLLPGLTSQVSALATLILMTNFAPALMPRFNAYYHRIMTGYRAQWPALLEKTIARLEDNPLRLATFHAGDAVTWLETIPSETAVVSFPPFFAGGYAKMWEPLDNVFDWDRPAFEEIFAEHRQRFITHLTSRPDWLFMTSFKLDDYAAHLRGIAQTTLRGMPVYMYASQAPTRIAVPRQRLTPVGLPRLAPGQRLGQKLSLLPLTPPQFAALRAQYLNPRIAPASAQAALSFGVMVDQTLVGCFALNFTYQAHGAASDTIYLLSDFAVAPTDYTRLAKLILYAARSHEARHLAERLGRRRVRHLFTTAFTDNPVSMKYRGLFNLHSRRATPEAEHAYMLNYTAPAGTWSLAEGFDLWRKQHGKTTHAD